MDVVFKALADPTRRKILSLLKKRDMTVQDLAAHFSFSGATLSHHLDVLKQARLVVVEKQGQFRCYSLNTSVLEEVTALVLGVLTK